MPDPTPLERILETFDKKYAHYVNLGPEIGESSTQTEIKMLITHAYEVGRNDAVDFIDREFNDERYAHFAGEDDDDEPVSTEEEAEFRMFWTDLLRAARGEGK